MKKLLYLLVLVVFLIGCKKSSSTAGKVAFYGLESYTLVDGRCQVNSLSAVVLKTTPFIDNADILSYSGSGYTYTLLPGAMERIKAMAGREPFAVTVDGEVIFYGFYNPSILSSSCEHSISLDADSEGTGNKIILRLGYPGLLTGVPVEDSRNDTRLINVLKAQGKWRP